jgi:hypothetical protein
MGSFIQGLHRFACSLLPNKYDYFNDPSQRTNYNPVSAMASRTTCEICVADGVEDPSCTTEEHRERIAIMLVGRYK